MTQKNSIEATHLAGAQASLGATMLAGGQVDQAALRRAEQAVALEWCPGDVILDLYEVRRVTEGFGEDAEEKDYHEGGFGRVYRVWHRTWRREMAVKTPRAGAFTTQAQKDAFTRECETWVNLGLHAHIAACHYVRELGGVPRVFSEYADAGTLEEWIRSQRLYAGDEQVALARMLDAVIQFAWGLHYAHEHKDGVIHQDVKPLNALLWNDGTLKVTDFGLAGARQKAGIVPDEAGGMRSIMVSMGGMTPSHCSPEQAAGQNLDRRTDVWSWAVSVLEMFQGEVTWQSGSLAAEALEAFLQQGGKEEDIPAMPAGVVALLRRCFQHDPANRPRTLLECAVALCEVCQAETGKLYPRAEPQAVGDTPDALNNRALSLLDLGKPDEAERLFDRALELDRHHVTTTYNRGLMRWRAGRCLEKDVLLSLEEIKKEHSDDAELECALGWVRMESGHFTEAIAQFEEAIDLGDESKACNGLEQAQSFARRIMGYPRTFKTHSVVKSVTFSPDCRFALSGGGDLCLWDVVTGECVRTFVVHSAIYSVAFSPDGRVALSGSDDNTLRLWDMATGNCLRTFKGHTDHVNSVAYSPDGRFALSGSKDSTVRLWDVTTGQCLRTFEGHEESVNSVAFSPDGRFALSGSKDSTVRLWDVATAQCLRTLGGDRGQVYSVAFSPDGRHALSGSRSDRKHNTFLLWEVVTGQCLRTFGRFGFVWEGHAREVRSVAFSPDGRFALCGSPPGEVLLLDAATGQCLRTFDVDSDWGCRSVAFSPDGCFVLSQSDVGMHLWEVSSAMERCLMGPWFYSTFVTAAEALERQRSHEAHLSQARQALERGDIVEALAFLRQARAVSGFERRSESLELQARIGARARVKSYADAWLKRTLKGHEGGVNSVAFSPDCRLALSGSEDRTLRLWDVATGQCLRTLKEGTAEDFSVVFSPDGRFALSGSGDWRLRLWDVATGQCLRTFEGHTYNVMSVAFSPDGRFALSGSWDGTLKLWEVATGQCLRSFNGHTQGVNSVTLSADGCFALSGSEDKTLRLWDVATGQSLRTFEGHSHPVGSVAFSPDGCVALSGSWYGGLKLWDVASGRCLRALKGHTDNVISVSFSPDGRFALSGSWDRTLRLWNVAMGQCLRTFEGPKEIINSTAFSPDGRFALCGSGDRLQKHLGVPFERREFALWLWELDWEYEYDPEHDPVLKCGMVQT